MCNPCEHYLISFEIITNASDTFEAFAVLSATSPELARKGAEFMASNWSHEEADDERGGFCYETFDIGSITQKCIADSDAKVLYAHDVAEIYEVTEVVGADPILTNAHGECWEPKR